MPDDQRDAVVERRADGAGDGAGVGGKRRAPRSAPGSMRTTPNSVRISNGGGSTPVVTIDRRSTAMGAVSATRMKPTVNAGPSLPSVRSSQTMAAIARNAMTTTAAPLRSRAVRSLPRPCPMLMF